MELLRSNSRQETGQLGVSPQQRMPVDDGNTANVQSVSGDTVQLYYYDAAGVETVDAGEAAGTVVVAALTHTNILNSLGTRVGMFGDTSFAFGTGTILTRQVPYRGLRAETVDSGGEKVPLSAQARADQVTEGFRNGDFCIDHENGMAYGVKATAGVSDTADYKVRVPGGGAAAAGSVNIAQVGGAAQDAAAAVTDATASPTVGSFGAYMRAFNGSTWDRVRAGITAVTSTLTGWLNTLPWAVYNSSPTTRTNGQGGPVESDAAGNIRMTLETLLSGEFLSEGSNGVIAFIDLLLGSNTFTPDVYVSSALEDDALLMNNEGNVFRASGYIDETAPSGLYWVFLLDSAAAPTNGAVTHLYPPIPVIHTLNTPSTWDFTQLIGRVGLHASNGVAVALSDTPISLTLSGDYLRVGGLTKDA